MAWRIFIGLLGICIATAGLFGTRTAIVDHKTSGNEVLVLASFLMVLLGGYCLISILMAKVVLSSDVIESTNGFSRRTMRREEIASWYFRGSGADSVLVLVSRMENHKDLKIPLYIKLGDVFYEWLDPEPDPPEQAD